MMYLDLSLLANFLMDYILLHLLYIRRKPKGLRIVLSALMGSFFSTASFFLPMENWLRAFFSLPLAAGMLLLAGSPPKPRLLGQDIFLFYIYSLLFSGMIPFLLQFFRLWLLCVAISFLLLRIFLYIGDRRKRILQLTIVWQDQRWTLQALVDSGNLLREPFSNLPVIVVAESCLPGHPILSHPIPYRTIDKESLLLAFRPDALYLDSVLSPPALIAPTSTFSNNTVHQALIPESLILP